MNPEHRKQEQRKVVRVEGAEIDAIARRRNELMVGKFRLSLQAHRLFLYVLSQVKDDHDENTDYEFSVYELAKAIGIDRNHLYKSMVDVLDELAGTIINVDAIDKNGEAETGTFVRVGLIKNRQQVRVSGDGLTVLEGRISVGVYKELLPYVRRLKERYTETELKYVFRLSSSYSQKLYDLLKTRAFTGRAWRVSRKELFELLSIDKGKFELWGDFRRFVLERAQAEIGAHTDLAFKIEYVMAGRTVTDLVFHLRKEGGHEIETLPGTAQHAVFKGMLDLGLKVAVAERILGEWWEQDPERVRYHLAQAKAMKASGRAKNAIGWFLSGLKKDFRPQRSLFAEMKKKAARTRAEYEAEKGKTTVAAEVAEALKQVHDSFGRHIDG